MQEDAEPAAWCRVEEIVRELYRDRADPILPDLRALLLEGTPSDAGRDPAQVSTPSRSDACLITYADSVCDPERGSPLRALRRLLSEAELQGTFPMVHLLPFFPWDTDRGFSVKDFRAVDPACGTWEDVAGLAEDVRLMFDFVANHASVDNPLVQGALLARHLPEDHPARPEAERYEGYVLAYSRVGAPSDEALAALARPRAAPVLTPYCVVDGKPPQAILGTREDPSIAGRDVLGEGLVWTTFSRGVGATGAEETRQVDLNYHEPGVFLEALRILVEYAGRGASLIRLDAVGYLWKALGSTSLHERETHRVLAAWKAALALAAPGVWTVAEVNEPQEKVLPYLGPPGTPEADLVYQFTHFPLAVHAVLFGEARHYQGWLETLAPAGGRQFVTVLGSHDGMGLKPVRGILPPAELTRLTKKLEEEHGALPNHAVLPGGERIVYELCATPWVLVNGPDEPADATDAARRRARLRAVAALGLIPRGLPAFYVTGAFGLPNYRPAGGLDENRTVNRERLDLAALLERLDDADGDSARVLADLCEMLAIRATQPAFEPDGPALRVLDVGDAPVVAALLPSQEEGEDLVALIEVAGEAVEVEVPAPAPRCVDVLGDAAVRVEGDRARVSLGPYGVAWVRRG